MQSGKTIEPVVLEGKLGGCGRAGFLKAHPAAVREQLTAAMGVLPCFEMGAEQAPGLCPGALAVIRVSCHSSAL